jgi:hypothetical protein
MGSLLGSGDQSTDNARNLGRHCLDALAWLKNRTVWRPATWAGLLIGIVANCGIPDEAHAFFGDIVPVNMDLVGSAISF